jgi:hypothetical protein
MTQLLLEAPTQADLLPPPSQEVTRENINKAIKEGLITELGANALKGVKPEIAEAVLARSRIPGKLTLH